MTTMGMTVPFGKCMPGVSSNKAPKDSQGKFWQPAGLKTRKSRAACGWIPSGYVKNNYGKSPFLIGKSP